MSRYSGPISLEKQSGESSNITPDSLAPQNRRDIRAKHKPLLSDIATTEAHRESSLYFEGWEAYNNNPYHPTKNPEGVIQMGLAENQLSLDMVQDWLEKHPAASICTPEGRHKFKEIANFQDFRGLPDFRKGVARFMEKARGDRVQLDPKRIVMAGGATGAAELISFSIANPGDAFLVPTPYYAAFYRDLGWRTKVKLLPVICNSANNFRITREALDVAHEKAVKSGDRVKAIVLSNPSNPLGTTLDRETLKLLVSFVTEKQIHLVCDEVYAGSVFGEPRDFVSVAEVVDEVDDCNRGLIHFIYSLSKDMGLPGFRVGIVYSYNEEFVARPGPDMARLMRVSSQTQYLAACALSDKEFVARYSLKNTEILRKRYEDFTSGVRKFGLTWLPSNAGLFCWMDLRPLLGGTPTFDAEMKVWRKILDEAKINVSPGSSFHCEEPGWFRFCFANMDDQTLELALERIGNFVESRRKDLAGRF